MKIKMIIGALALAFSVSAVAAPLNAQKTADKNTLKGKINTLTADQLKTELENLLAGTNLDEIEKNALKEELMTAAMDNLDATVVAAFSTSDTTLKDTLPGNIINQQSMGTNSNNGGGSVSVSPK
jgi:hypothetical protein